MASSTPAKLGRFRTPWVRQHALGCNAARHDETRNGIYFVKSKGCAVHQFASCCGATRRKPLLTGWSLVRIRPGEPKSPEISQLGVANRGNFSAGSWCIASLRAGVGRHRANRRQMRNCHDFAASKTIGWPVGLNWSIKNDCDEDGVPGCNVGVRPWHGGKRRDQAGTDCRWCCHHQGCGGVWRRVLAWSAWSLPSYGGKSCMPARISLGSGRPQVLA